MATAANAMDFVHRGMNFVQATELANEINGTPETPDAIRFMGVGFPAPLATELSAQITAQTGNETKLRGLGVPFSLAQKIAASITAAF